jgi:hypothetical protein
MWGSQSENPQFDIAMRPRTYLHHTIQMVPIILQRIMVACLQAAQIVILLHCLFCLVLAPSHATSVMCQCYKMATTPTLGTLGRIGDRSIPPRNDIYHNPARVPEAAGSSNVISFKCNLNKQTTVRILNLRFQLYAVHYIRRRRKPALATNTHMKNTIACLRFARNVVRHQGIQHHN